jgi:hypothetical protein
MPFTLSNIFGSRAVDAPAAADQTKPQEIELTDISSKPSAPTASVAQAVEKDTPTNFEWNVGRLFSREPGKSEARTWAVRILSTLFVLPLVLTAIVDIGRRLAYSAGFVDGKSFSLIDKVSEGCKSVASKVASVYQSSTKPLTKEELNAKSEKAIKALAQKLVDGFRALNGDYFTDSSFSSSAALKGERQIKTAKDGLVDEISDYVSRNATGTDDFIDSLAEAETMAQSAIDGAAGDDFYIQDKSKRIGPRPFIRDRAKKELDDRIKSAPRIQKGFIQLAKQESDFSAGLKKGIEAGILKEDQAKSVFTEEVEASYTEGLKIGLDEANVRIQNLFDSAVKSELITKGEVDSIEESLQPDVSALAKAAAKDVTRDKTPETTDDKITVQLSQAADALIARKKLKPEDETQFLSAAKDQLAKVKEDVEAEALREKQEAEEIQAQQAAEAQQAADQSKLFGRFSGMLSLISQKQEELRAQFLKFDELEKERQIVTDSLETIRTTRVAVRHVPMTVLQAAGEYYKAIAAISNSNSKPAAKTQQVKDLAIQGFGQRTIDLINQLKALEPKLTEVLDNQSSVVQKIENQHEEVSKLNAQFKVYKKHNASQLEPHNRKAVGDKEKEVDAVQKTLDQKYRQLAQAGTSLIDRLRSEPMRVVNLDPAINKGEVEALVDAFDKAQNPPSEETVETVVPQANSVLWNTLSGITSRVMMPFSAIAARWRGAAPSA